MGVCNCLCTLQNRNRSTFNLQQNIYSAGLQIFKVNKIVCVKIFKNQIISVKYQVSVMAKLI